MSEPVLCQLGQVNLLKEFAEECEGWPKGKGEALHCGLELRLKANSVFWQSFFKFFFLFPFFFLDLSLLK